MDAVEKAIRNALAKGDERDPGYREQVYRSVEAALERALVGSATLSQEAVEERRAGLQQTIVRVERETRARLEEEAASPGFPTHELPEAPARQAGRAEPSLDTAAAPTLDAPSRAVAEEAQRVRSDPGFHGGEFPEGPARRIGPAPEAELLPPGHRRERPRRRGIVLAFVAATLVVIVAGGLYFANSLGLFLSSSERDTAVRTAPALEEEAYAPGATAGASQAPLTEQDDGMRNWVAVFSPDDPTSAVAPGDAMAEVVQEGEENFMRIRSGGSGSEILFDVAPGVLERIAGRRAVFAIAAKSGAEQATQISVACDFGDLGDCGGRKRYEVGLDRSDYLFEVQLPSGAANAEGTIAINSDVEGGGKALDIFEIKVDAE